MSREYINYRQKVQRVKTIIAQLATEEIGEHELLTAIGENRAERWNVKWGMYPSWFPKENRFQHVHIPGQDHIGKVKWTFPNCEYFISEPYGLGMEKIEEVIQVCHQHQLQFMIDGQSSHFPGNTFRMLFYPAKETSLPSGGLQQYPEDILRRKDKVTNVA